MSVLVFETKNLVKTCFWPESKKKELVQYNNQKKKTKIKKDYFSSRPVFGSTCWSSIFITRTKLKQKKTNFFSRISKKIDILYRVSFNPLISFRFWIFQFTRRLLLPRLGSAGGGGVGYEFDSTVFRKSFSNDRNNCIYNYFSIRFFYGFFFVSCM